MPGTENLTSVGTHRTQGKCGYLCLYGVEKILLRLEHISKCGNLRLAPNALVENILLQLEYIEFKANVVICDLL